MTIESGFSANLFELYKDLLSRLRRVKLTKLQEGISHELIIPHASYSPWLDDEDFLTTYELIKANTLVDQYRCYELWSLIKKNKNLAGAILEVGVWKGGTGALMAKANQLYSTGVVYLADTFSGVVKASDQDTIYKGGEHKDTSEDTVKSLLVEVGVSNVKLLTGIFPDDIKLDDSVWLKLCHIDVDTYQSAADIFEYIWPKMVKGGIVIFDDYGFWGCEGVTKLCNTLKLADGIFLHNLNGHGIAIKL